MLEERELQRCVQEAIAALPDSLRRSSRPALRRLPRPTGFEPLAPVNVLKPVPAQ